MNIREIQTDDLTTSFTMLTVECTACFDTYSVAHEGKLTAGLSSLVDTLNENGWSVSDQGMLCPLCVSTYKETGGN